MLHRPKVLLFLILILLMGRTSVTAQPAVPQGWHSVVIPDAWRNVPSGKLQPIEGY